MIRAIILDCFGVLYVDPTAYFYTLALTAGNKEQAAEFAELIRQANRGFITQDEFASQVAELFALPESHVRDKLLKNLARNTELVTYSQELRSTYKLGMLSNISRGTMDNFFSPAERTQLFDDVILSGEVGLIKPQPEIFELAAQHLGVEPSEIVFVDDSQNNCNGAEAVGMKTIHFETNTQLKSELEELLAKK